MTIFDDSLSLLLSADDDEMSRYQAWNGPRIPLPEDAFVDLLIERAALGQPDRIALLHRDTALSYRTFWQRVEHGVRVLAAAGVGPGRAVAIALPAGVDRMVAVVAALRCGACFLPLNLDHPIERLRRQFDDCGRAVLVAATATADALGLANPLDLAAEPAGAAIGQAPARQVSDYAYVIHTSGSTGLPKGCAIRHDSLYNRLVWMRDALQVGPDDRILHKTAFGFDVSVWEQLLPLMVGATIVIADTENARDAHQLTGLIERHRVTISHFVPTLLDAFLDQERLEGCASLRAIVCSGEALPKATALRCHSRLPAALYNYYGPTEAAIDVTAWRFDPAQDYSFVPIGLPIDNVDAHVLRDDLTPAPLGAEGELYLGGIAVGAGYLRRPTQSAERFIPDPFSGVPGSRLYRTGDIVRRHADGSIEYLGRRDMQVKLRGFRIELGEIEAVLRLHPAVSQAAVIVSDEPRQLLAYVVPGDGRQLAEIETELRAAASRALPSYMVPAVWIGLPSMPTTVNGKLDRAALPKPARHGTGDAKPEGEREEALASIWQSLLGLPEVDAVMNFFAAGGDSILAIKLVARARAKGLRFEVNDVFSHPTLRQLAAHAEVVSAAGASNLPLPAPVSVWLAGFTAQDCVVAMFDWPVPDDVTETGLQRLDQLLISCQAGLTTGLRLPSSGADTLRELTRRLVAEPRRAFAAARDGRHLMLALPPHSADWSGLPRLASLLENNDQAIGSVNFQQWADAARQLPMPPLSRTAATGRLASAPLCYAGRVSMPASWQQRRTSSGGAEDGLIDLVCSAALQAMAGAGIDNVHCRLPESRAWAARTGWELSHCFGRLALEHTLALPLDGWKGDAEQLLSLHLARSGRLAANTVADATAVNCRIVVIGTPEGSALGWSGEYPELLAQSLAVEGELLLVALLEQEAVRFCWSGTSPWLAEVAGRTADAIGRCCSTSFPLRTGDDFPDSQLAPASALAGPLAVAADAYPLAPMQEGMLLRSIYWPDSDAYFNQNLIELRGPLQRQALVDSWMTVVARYEALRTGYLWEGLETPLQHIAVRTRHGVDEHDWHAISHDEAAIEARLAAFMDADRSLPFDLREPGLWRFSLIHLAPERHFLVWSHHHILLDGWCLSLIWGDVFKQYAATVEGRPLPQQRPRPYRDYLAWLRHHGAARRNPAYWRDYLEGYEVPTLFSRHSPDKEGRFDTWRIKLSEEKTTGLNELARNCEITVNAVIQAAWSLMLGMETGSRDVIHGVAVSGRPPDLDGSEQMVGLFINTLPLRLRHQPGQSVRDFLRETQRTLAEASRQADLPLAEIAGQWRSRRYGDERLFDSLIAFENYPENNLPQGRTGGLDIIDRFCDEKTEYPFGLIVLPGKALELHFNFDTAHFERAEVERLTVIYRNLLDAMVAQPDGVLANLPGPEQSMLQSPAVAEATSTLDAMIARQAQARPDAPALIEESLRWSYADLSVEVGRLATIWQQAGVAAGDTVLLLLPRSAQLAASVLALWRLGATPAVLNTAHPPAIRSACAALVKADWILADEDNDLPGKRLAVVAEAVEAVPAPATRPGRMILFTSGSTGRPKAVLCLEQGLIDRIRVTAGLYGTAAPVLLANAAAGFDIGLWEMFFPLLQGGTVVLAPDHSLRDFGRFAGLITAHGVDTLHLIPSLLELLLEAATPAQLAGLKVVVSGGESLPAGLLRRWFALGLPAALWQGYGPTEASVSVVDHLCRPEDGEGHRVPLGKPSGGTGLYLLDDWYRPVAPGVEGNVYLAGRALALGYLGGPAATAEAFLPDPWGEPGSVMYRTGDRALLRSDGLLEFHGRQDRQIKLRGQRIDLSMLEQLLGQHPAVREVAVVLAAGTSSTLTGHISLKEGANPAAVAAMPQWLATELPYGLTLPVQVHASLPVNANGKLDRGALTTLPVPCADAGSPQNEGPQNPVEKAVWAAWTEVLGSRPAHRHSNFFASGGHSLAAMRLVLATRRRLDANAKVEVTHLFKFPTVAGMAEAIHAGTGGSGRDHVFVVNEPAAAAATPLFLIHPVEGMALCYAGLGAVLGERKVYAFSNPRQLERDKFASLAEMAQLYVEWVRSLAGDGPVLLGGWSFGGVVALEMARQMRAHGSTVEAVLLIDSYQLAGQHALMLRHDRDAPTEVLRDEIRHNTALALANVPTSYDGRVILLQAQDDTSDLGPCNGWSSRTLPGLTLRHLQGCHHDLFKPEFVGGTAAAIRIALEEIPQ